MKKLVLVALAMGALATAPACTTSDDPPPDGVGFFDVEWSVATAHGTPDCFNIAEVVVVSTSVTVGDIFEDSFACEPGGGVTAALPLDDYDVVVDFYDAGGGLVAQSNESVPALLDIDGETVLLPLFTSDPMGTFSLTWQVNDQAGTDIGCISNDAVSLLSVAFDDASSYEDVWDCVDEAGTTAPTPIGDFDVDVLLEDANGDPISQTEVFQADILFDTENVDLGHVIFVEN